MPHNHYLGNYLGKYPDYPIVGRSQVASSIHDEIDSSRLVGMQTSRGGSPCNVCLFPSDAKLSVFARAYTWPNN